MSKQSDSHEIVISLWIIAAILAANGGSTVLGGLLAINAAIRAFYRLGMVIIELCKKGRAG